MPVRSTGADSFWFADTERLRVLAGRAGLRGGRGGRGEDGVIVAFDPPPTGDAVAAWGEQGVRRAALPADARPLLHWAELVPLDRDASPDEREVIFVLRPGDPWTRVAAELLRLGCPDQALRRVGAGWAIRARAPSYYTIAGCLERNHAVLVRQLPQVWVPWGRRHPMAAELAVPAGSELWLTDPWQLVDDIGWVDVLTAVDLDLPARPPPQTPAPPERLRVRLRLTRGGAAVAPTLWLTDRPTVERLAWTLPEEVISRLEFAATEAGVVAVRARAGAAIQLVLPEPFTPHPVVPHLWVPAGWMVDPPLRAETLQAVLAPGPGFVGWLRERDGGLALERLPEQAFHVLADWVTYEADRSADAVRAWMGTALFEWTPPDLPTTPEVVERRSRGPEPAPDPGSRRVSAMAPPPVSPPEARMESLPEAPAPAAPPVEAEPTNLEAHLFALQEALRAEPGRSDLWPRVATAYTALRRPRDAALCWGRAVWEAPDPRPLVAAWASTQPNLSLPSGYSPTDVIVGCVAILAGSQDRAAGPWFAEREHVLDVRTRWLVHHALARRDEDPLALARGRDRVLAALRHGLVVSRDQPDFLRGSASAADLFTLEASLAGLRAALDEIAPPGPSAASTRVYAHFTLAWAQAGLGLRSDPVQVPAAMGDPLHVALVGLYAARVDQARIGLPAEVPPPPDVADRLARLDRFATYKAARLRESSVVLAQPGQSDAFQGFVEDVPNDEAVPQDEVEARVRSWFAQAPAPAALRRGLGTLVALPSGAEPWLVRAIADAATHEPLIRVPLLEDALSVAAAVRASDAAVLALAPLRTGLSAMIDDPRLLERALRDLPRNLTRLRLGAAGRDLFASLRGEVPPEAHLAQVIVDGALAECGGDARDTLPAALAATRAPQSANDRVSLACATARLAAGAPVGDAVRAWGELARLGPALGDAYSTNTHFYLNFLRVMDAIAAAHVHPDRLLTPEDWAALEADEHAVRVRIHQESRW